MAERSVEHVDVLIIGAGLSGIGAAAHLTRELPRTSYVVLEAREVSGGTWDLFRYPGVRSDSDMYTMGYRFRPWRHEEALGSGERILEYLRDTAREYDVERAHPLLPPGRACVLGLARRRSGRSRPSTTARR